MKKPFSFRLQSAVLAVSLAAGAHVFAQEPGGAPEIPAPPPHRGMMDPAQQMEGMTKRYNLSADQQTQLKPILAWQQQQMQALRGDSSLSREDRMARCKAFARTKTKIEAVLNDDHKRQFEADQQKMEERMQQRMQGGVGRVVVDLRRNSNNTSSGGY